MMIIDMCKLFYYYCMRYQLSKRIANHKIGDIDLAWLGYNVDCARYVYKMRVILYRYFRDVL